ncbi:hypothetical protein MBCUT_02080 [Methanobrevibacter cuticularis]|uniref:Uncharacterized protein n=1 Tax=Methanobrevibacter cuticularis TaxID=47311 RepID=A0A166FCG9_9EURY|nr:hypothetical protein [Methanobrevibacter cuticularis]KZX17533.1 hypothetical protein MBCUT_02080 [Methanobrevibacter cuticularis]
MPKKDTLKIQEKIRELGEKLGFISVTEETLHENNSYVPEYDVVWYLDLEKHLNLENIKEFFKEDPEMFEQIKRLPFAGFEIEGSSTNSKYQLGNFLNLYSGKFIYNFVIVNNNGHSERDIYRRGMKIKHYFAENSGDKNIIFLDTAQFDESIERLSYFDMNIQKCDESMDSRSRFGGETKSEDIYKKISPFLETDLIVKQNYSSIIPKIKHKILKRVGKHVNPNSDDKFPLFFLKQEYYKFPDKNEVSKARQQRDNFYIPKLDLVLGFNAPKGFVSWLLKISESMKNDYVHYPILFGLKEKLISINELFIPLISMEIETSVSKHANGGVYNMSKNSFMGILVTKSTDKSMAKNHVTFFKNELGLNNILNYYVDM